MRPAGATCKEGLSDGGGGEKRQGNKRKLYQAEVNEIKYHHRKRMTVDFAWELSNLERNYWLSTSKNRPPCSAKMKIKCFRQQKKIRLQNAMPPDFDQTIETWRKDTNEQINYNGNKKHLNGK